MAQHTGRRGGQCRRSWRLPGPPLLRSSPRALQKLGPWPVVHLGWLCTPVLANINLHFQNCSCFFFPLIFIAVRLLFTFFTLHSCFTTLYWFLLYSKVNRLYIHIYTLPVGIPSHSGHHTALVPGTILCILISYLFYTSILYMCHSQFPPPLPFPLVPIHLFSKPLSVSAFQIRWSTPFFQITHMLIYNICFSLSNLLHSVWQSPGPSTSL